MKSLLIKDWKLLKNQRQFFGSMALILVIFLAVNQSPEFVISYAVMILMLFTLSTIQYDEYENGMSYLLTLPIGRKEYVLEKYVFGLLSAVISGIVMLLLTAVLAKVRGAGFIPDDFLAALVAAFLIASVMMAYTIPIRMKFGSEKSRIATIGFMMVLFILGFGVVKLLERNGRTVGEVFDKLDGLPIGMLSAGMLGAGVVLLAISMAVSMRIIQKKEY